MYFSRYTPYPDMQAAPTGNDRKSQYAHFFTQNGICMYMLSGFFSYDSKTSSLFASPKSRSEFSVFIISIISICPFYFIYRHRMKKAATKNAPVRMLSLTAFLRFYYFLFGITASLCSRSSLFLIKLQDRHKCLLWYLHIAHLSHSLLSFLLFFKELSLS